MRGIYLDEFDGVVMYGVEQRDSDPLEEDESDDCIEPDPLEVSPKSEVLVMISEVIFWAVESRMQLLMSTASLMRNPLASGPDVSAAFGIIFGRDCWATTESVRCGIELKSLFRFKCR